MRVLAAQAAADVAAWNQQGCLSPHVIYVEHGGGVTGQADAIRLGVARAMVAMDPKLRTALRAKGLLTRDPRAVERKKSGQPKARKRFQYSKR